MFKRTGDAAAAGVADGSDPVQQARTRARRRLIGAVVLLVIGVIGFPLVFETRPRPVPIDIPIEIPRQDAAPPLSMPPPRSSPPVNAAPTPPLAAAPATTPSAPSKGHEPITEARSDAGRDVTPRADAAKAAPTPDRPASKAADRSAEPPVAEAARKAPPGPSSPSAATPPLARPAPQTAAVPAGDAARAKALLDGKPASAAESGRFVVQVGAFAEAESARETRSKAEKLGLKTYTQVAQTPSGSRIRVRIGPFGSRAEADAALAKARAAGLTAVVLTL